MTGILNILAGALGVAKDTYFNLVSLLLPGNGTNGAQNNTFLDSSTNNFTITRNGNTTQGTFSPFSQTGWGNYFNGSSYLSSPGFNFSTSDFTIECFINTSSLTAGPQPISGYTTTGLNYTITIETGGVFKFYLSSNGSSWDIASGVVLGTATVGKWHHIVIVRSGNSIRGYFDGTGGTTTTSSAAIYNNSTAFYIGAAGGAGGNITGYFSNVRVLLGTAAYSPASSTITVPTAPFAAGTTNQVLLTCQANRFVDSNTATTAKTITVSGSPSVVAFSPFAPTAAYTTAAVGGSGYFDGTGDYLTTPSSTNFAFGGNWTIEFWFYPISQSMPAGLIAFSDNKDNLDYTLSSNSLSFYNGSSSTTFTGVSVTVSAWNHVAIVNSSGTVRAYINGNQSTNSASGVTTSSSRSFNILANTVGSAITNCYVSSFRVVNGTAVYTTAFTPPTAPLTAITNTSLLLNFTNAGITDATAKNDLETVGNAQISTSVSKFGGGSIYLDGTSDYLSIPQTVTLAYGTGNFTVEFWLYRAGNVTVSDCGVIDQRDGGSGAYFMCGINTSQQFFVFLNSAYRIGPSASTLINQNTWYHIAYVRSSTTGTLYINGSSVGSWADNLNYVTNKTLIGRHSGGGTDFNGYLDDIRITNGYARYTSNFTPPTAPFPVQ